MLERIEHGTIVELRLSRPPANALNVELVGALREAVREATEGGVAGIVLSGAPGMFSAGLDVPELLQEPRPVIEKAWTDFYDLLRALALSPVPTAAAITGHSPAGGAVLAIMCDYRVMARGSFRIGLNEVQVGLPLPPVILRVLSAVVGPRRAEDLGVGGRMLGPFEALAAGLIDDLVDPEEVVGHAMAWCEARASLPPVAMATTRRLARRRFQEIFDETDESEILAVAEAWFSEETQATMRALVERLQN